MHESKKFPIFVKKHLIFSKICAIFNYVKEIHKYLNDNIWQESVLLAQAADRDFLEHMTAILQTSQKHLVWFVVISYQIPCQASCLMGVLCSCQMLVRRIGEGF